MASPQEPKFDPNAALREFNAYFGSLRKDYGEDAIRGAGFTPRDLSLLQASLRKLQMDPNATPEQHRQAYQQARDALAQRITTPLAAARPTPSAPPEVEVRGVRPPDVVNAPMPEMSVRPVEAPRPVMPEMPVTPPLPVMPDPYAKRNPRPSNYVVVGERGGHPIYGPPPAQPMPVPSATDYIAMVTPPRPPAPSMAQPEVMPPVALPGGSGYDERGNMLKSQPKSTLDDMMQGVRGSMLPPMQPVGSPALLGDAPRPIDPSMVPSTAPGILPGITQQQPAAPSMNTQPGADFDRNVGRQIFDAEFRTLREKYGDEGLRAAGLTPRTLASLQAPLTNVQRDNTISYDQSSAALEDALQQLRGYNFGGAQPAAPMPAGAQGMAMGGLINKYYR
jgi:hypothetical protein